MKQLGLIAVLCMVLSSAFDITRAAPAVDVAPQQALGAPVLKWAYGGCALPYCERGWYASPAVADLNNDQQPEVIWGGYDLTALNGANGSVQWRGDNASRIWPGIAVADLTGDGSLEVIVGRGGNQLTVYGNAGAVLWTRTPFANGEIRALAVEDLESDGQLEIIVGRASSGGTRQVSVYAANGTVRAGWPARRDGEPGYGAGMYNENLAIADLNRDGFKEIFAPTDSHYITALDRNGNQLSVNALYGAGKVWSQVGVHVDQAADLRGYANCGTEHRPNFADAAPAIGDLNGDNQLELIVPGDVYNCAVGDPAGDMYYLPWILNRDRTRWAASGFNWTVLPTPKPNSGPLSEDYNLIERAVVNAVLADLDGDGQQEILYPSYDGRLHAFWLDKTEHANWPFDVPGEGIRFASEPAVADLDADGRAEVIFTSWPQKGGNRLGQLHILNDQGTQLFAVNLPAPAQGQTWNGGLGAPTLANIDADPALEAVVGTAASGVAAYDLPGSEQARVLWGTGRGSLRRTGLAPAAPFVTLLAARSSRSVTHGGTTSYALRLNGSGASQATLSVNAPPNLTVSVPPGPVAIPSDLVVTVTDTHAGSVAPGLWQSFSITATSGALSHRADLRLLVDGSPAYLPTLRR